MNENEKEQMFEITGWYAAYDDYVVMKVDRCIHLGNAWHYHVLIDADGDEVDTWYADFEHNDECPGIYETKEQAEERVKLEQGAWKNREQAIQKKHDVEDAPLVEKLHDLGTDRVSRMVKKAFPACNLMSDMSMDVLRSQSRILEILLDGGIDHEKGNTSTFIPLGSIDTIQVDCSTTTVMTKTAVAYIYKGVTMGNYLKTALKIYNNH